MYFRLMGKLNARRNNLLAENEKGFTLIELLVVVIIIGILAAIAIPVYLNVTNNAKDSSVQSDVANWKTAIVSVQSSTGTLPTAGTAASSSDTTTYTSALKAAGASFGSNTTQIIYQTVTGGTGFCVEGDSSTGKKFAASDSTGVSAGTCVSGAFVKATS